MRPTARPCKDTGMWPMAKDGSMPIPHRPSSSSLTTFRWDCLRSSRIVHCCPFQPTNWRSSSQMSQLAGVWSLSANWVPHVVQMKFGMATHSFGSNIRPKNRIASLLSGLGYFHWVCGRFGYGGFHQQHRFPRKLLLFSTHIRISQPCKQLVGP